VRALMQKVGKHLEKARRAKEEAGDAAGS
jgi:hypothetical protein